MLQTRAFRFAPYLLTALLAACGTAPKPLQTQEAPSARPPPGVLQTPDATPQVEPVREGGPNKPYALGGRSYTPQTGDKPFAEKGVASWYGKPFHGRRTASGEIYNMYAMTAAHKTLPIPSYARVRNPANGREAIVRVNDRGPFHQGRVIDLSYAAAIKLGVTDGLAPVEVERITFDDIRTGAWKRDAKPDASPDSTAPDVVAVEASVSPVSADLPDATTPSRAFTAAARGFWVQLGAFRQRDGAEKLQRQVSDDLGWLSPLLAVFSEAQVYRLQAGPYPTKADAQSAAGRVRDALKLAPIVVERR